MKWTTVGDIGVGGLYPLLVQLIPPNLVPIVQAHIAAQGLDPNLIQSNGELGASSVLGLLFDTVEVKTSVTPSLKFPIAASGEPTSSAMQELVSSLQPTVVFTGRAGRVEVAPYGAAQGATSWLPLIAVGAVAILGIGYLVYD